MSTVIDAAAVAERLERVRGEIADAAREAGRSSDELTLIVVTKYQPLELIDVLAELGVRDFGENRHPESRNKAQHIHELRAGRLHFIGQLQRNKARQVGRYADAVHSIDREELVTALSTLDRGETAALDVLMQLSLDGDPGRGGVPLADAEALAEQIAATPTIRLRGVMAVAPLGADPLPAFEQVRLTSERVRAIVPDAEWISAGMSHDFPSAISQGATHLRIGTAITGNRPTAP